jgi:uncharacterized linocin/CFP29 family protein
VNNLYRELAPVSDAAWEQIEQEVARTFKTLVAGRRIVDVESLDAQTAAISTGHVSPIAVDHPAVVGLARQSVPVIELRAEFTLSRSDIDDVERGRQDSDWQPAKDAATALAAAEDRTIFDGVASHIGGVCSVSDRSVPAPADVLGFPTAVAAALGKLRLAGVEGPYALVLSEQDYVQTAALTESGLPVSKHLSRLVGTEPIMSASTTSPVVASTRGGDFTLYIAQDVSIGYLSHTDTEVRLYLQEAISFQDFTSEAAVVLGAGG